jgi:hypothetical protein
MTRKMKRHIILATLNNKNKIQLAKFSHPKRKEKKNQDRRVWGLKYYSLLN